MAERPLLKSGIFIKTDEDGGGMASTAVRTVMVDDTQFSSSAVFELKSRNSFTSPVAFPEGEFSAVLSPANCSLLDDIMGGMVMVRPRFQ